MKDNTLYLMALDAQKQGYVEGKYLFNGTEYPLGVSNNYITVWSENRTVTLAEAKYDINASPQALSEKLDSVIAYLDRILSDWEYGYIACLDCGRMSKYEDVKHNQYFTGIYCDRCWDKKWKRLAEEEVHN